MGPCMAGAAMGVARVPVVQHSAHRLQVKDICASRLAALHRGGAGGVGEGKLSPSALPLPS